MNQDLLNMIAALAAVGSLIVTAGGLYAVYYQIKKLRESIWSNTHGKLCDQSFELIRFLADKPETYDYFYNGKALGEGHKDKAFILYAAEALANFMEHLVLQRQNLPERQWEVWQRFIFSTCEGSIVVREFIQSHRQWYCDELISMTDEYDKRLSGDAI